MTASCVDAAAPADLFQGRDTRRTQRAAGGEVPRLRAEASPLVPGSPRASAAISAARSGFRLPDEARTQQDGPQGRAGKVRAVCNCESRENDRNIHPATNRGLVHGEFALSPGEILCHKYKSFFIFGLQNERS